MNTQFRTSLTLAALAALLTLSACAPAAAPGGSSAGAGESVPAPAALAGETVVDLNGDGRIDICEAVPGSVWEQVMVRPMAGDPQPFQDADLGDGCAFDFGNDGGAAYFAYVTLASEDQYNRALAGAVQAEPVTTVGDSAFLNYGPDARQLWVRVGDAAVLVAIGDRENVAGALVVAEYLARYARGLVQADPSVFSGTWLASKGLIANYPKLVITTQGDAVTTVFFAQQNGSLIEYNTATATYQGGALEYPFPNLGYTITLTSSGNGLNLHFEYRDKNGNVTWFFDEQYSQ